MTSPNPDNQTPKPGKLYQHLATSDYQECIVCGMTSTHYHPEGWELPKDLVVGKSVTPKPQTESGELRNRLAALPLTRAHGIMRLGRRLDDRDINTLAQFIQSELDRQKGELVDGNTSDGYHTFNELYEFRLLYNAALFNEWATQDLASKHLGDGKPRWDVHKSNRHSDGELCFDGGWFVVVAQLPTGQITNHYEDKYWELFAVPARERADKWDGHTPQDVAKRLREWLTGHPAQAAERE